jgi:RES domain-containing protein
MAAGPPPSARGTAMTLWRICRRQHAALDGEGARLFGSRWTPRGSTAVFASDSLALAALECFVHAAPEFQPDDLVALRLDLDPRLEVEIVPAVALPARWRDYPPPPELVDIGQRWLEAGRTVALSVPSAIVPVERNVILNPSHADFRKVRAASPEPFSFDPRMWKSRGLREVVAS